MVQARQREAQNRTPRVFLHKLLTYDIDAGNEEVNDLHKIRHIIIQIFLGRFWRQVK